MFERKDDTTVFLQFLLKMGEALLQCGAEVFRVEDTINRMGYAYGAEEMNVFVITSSMVITMEMPGGYVYTQTRRIRELAGNNFLRMEMLNELSREYCHEQCPTQELVDRFEMINQKKVNRLEMLFGGMIGAAGFCVFFGGNLFDAWIAALVSIVIWELQKYISSICINSIIFNFVTSFVSGVIIVLLSSFLPLHMDKVMIGDIMILIPGLMITNAVRDIIVGDIISGIMRFIEAILLAVALAIGFMGAIWVVERIIL